jgi:transketolase
MPAIMMRRSFADLLHEKMTGDARIWVVTGDMGYKMWDRVKMDFPERFVNAGAAEQVMVGLSVGLALEGKIPFVYSITPFLLYRPFETIRNYVNREKVPVKLVSSGRNRDYSHDGFSHWAEEDKEIMKIFRNIRSRWPETKEEIPGLVEEMINNPVPYYINLRK